MLPQADVLSIHLPAVEATKSFVNADLLARLKPECLLVNTARGSVLDEDALYDALVGRATSRRGVRRVPARTLSTACLRIEISARCQTYCSCRISGSNTVEANEAMARASLANVSRFLQGRISELTRVDAP